MNAIMPDLSGFNGTKSYWKWNSVSIIFLTDGIKYLIDELNAGWLISAAEHFLTTSKKIKKNQIIEIKLNVKKNGNAMMTIENDFGVYGKRKFKTSTFPSGEICFWASFYDQKWIIMLPSEY